jgi:two-component sensor histidine kinase
MLTLQTYGAGSSQRLQLGGDRINLSPKAASALCMTLHELMTNAAKYGAFSTPAGIVSIRWSTVATDADPAAPATLRLEWKESGGPPVSPPTKRGLGAQLIEDGVAYELGGAVRTEYAPEGLRCVIEFPLNDQNTRRGRFEQHVSNTQTLGGHGT